MDRDNPVAWIVAIRVGRSADRGVTRAPGELAARRMAAVCSLEARTAVHAACVAGFEDLVQFLAECLAEVDVEDSNGTRPVLIASGLGHEDVVQRLVQLRANPNRATSDGVAPIHAACAGGHSAAALVLARCRADIRAPDSDGWSPLHVAIHRGDMWLVRVLASYGACFHDTGHAHEHLALIYAQYAAQQRRWEVAEFLRRVAHWDSPCYASELDALVGRLPARTEMLRRLLAGHPMVRAPQAAASVLQLDDVQPMTRASTLIVAWCTRRWGALGGQVERAFEHATVVIRMGTSGVLPGVSAFLVLKCLI